MRIKTLLTALLIGVTTSVSLGANYYWLATRYDNNWFEGRNWSNTSSTGVAIGNTNYYAGGAYPGATDNVFIDAATSGQVNYGSQGITMQSITWTGAANGTTEMYGYGNMIVNGNFTLVPNMKVNISYLTFNGGSVITTAGNDMKDCNVFMYGGFTSSLAGDYYSSTTSGKFTIGGVFNTNGYNITVQTVAIGNSDATFNMSSSIITCYDFNMNYSSTVLTINPGASTVKFINYFVGMNMTYYNVIKTGTSGLNDAILGSQTFNNLTINPDVTCYFGAGSNQTINGTITANGTAGSRVALGSYGSGTYTLTKASGNVNMDYADITNGIATGGANFTTTNSTKINCHGWDRVTTPITFAGASKTYGNATFTMNASSVSTGAFTYSIIAGSSFASINSTTGVVTILGAGSATVQAMQAADVDYLTNTTTATLIIAKAALTVTANNVAKTYGTANPSFTMSYSGFVGSETASNLTTAPTATSAALLTTPVGTATIVPTGGASANYTFSYVNGTLYINPAFLTITINNQSRVYGGADPTFTFSYSGFVNGETVAVLTALPTCAPSSNVNSNIGSSYIINFVNLPAAANYTFNYVNGYLSITKAVLTVTAASTSRTYGAANPVFNVNYSGFVNGETATVLTTSSTATSAAVATTAVGTASIVPAGGTATNYSLNYVNGILTINKAVLTATANNASKIYGSANPAFAVSYTGFLNGETSSIVTTVSTATSVATPASVVGSYTIVPSGGIAANYSFTYANGSLSVMPAPITVKVNDVSRSYGSANPAFSYSYTGFVNGDDATAFSIPFSTPVTTATTGTAVGTYTINAAGGNIGPNYTSGGGGSITSGTLTITKASLTVTAANASRTYGASNPTFTVNYSGFVNSESAANLTTQPTATSAAVATTPAGTAPIVAAGATATNYSFTYVNGTLTINQASLTITANDASRIYDAANPGFTIGYTGFVNGETSSVLNVPSTATSSATTTSDVGTYSIVPSGGMAANYSFSYVNGTLTITKANQIITFNALVSAGFGSGSITLNATSTSGLPVTYASSDNAVASVSGNTLTIVEIGTCNITASQTGDTNYNAANSVVQPFIVETGQAITFQSLSPMFVTDGTFNLTATANSGLAVSYSSSNLSVATISGNTVTIVGAGSSDITASQGGDATYAPAVSVTQTLTINLVPQSITFSVLPSKEITDPAFSLSATASSGLSVTYSSSNLQVATITGNTVTIVGTGSTNIIASQTGNATFAAATPVTQSLTVESKIISLSGTTVASDTLDFGNQVVLGLSSAQKFTITNSGTTSLSISSISYPTGFTGDQSNGILAAGGSMDVNVTFTPIALGELTGAITFTSDATSGLDQIIAKGTAVKITGIEKSTTRFSIYPNPSNGIFYIEGVDDQNKNPLVEILDVTGRTIGSFSLSNDATGKYHLDISSQNNGLYLVRLSNTTVRIIKN